MNSLLGFARGLWLDAGHTRHSSMLPQHAHYPVLTPGFFVAGDRLDGFVKSSPERFRLGWPRLFIPRPMEAGRSPFLVE